MLQKEHVGNNCPENRIKAKKNPMCLFCDKPASPSDPLHEAMMKVIGERVKRCAIKVLEEKLMAKVSSWDLVASEGNFHAKYLVALYNAANRINTSEEADSHTTEVHYARAFAELVAFVEDTLTDREECSPVFKLSNLVRLYTSD